jgi:uncharacterized protein (TIGR02266 family)
MHFLDREFVHGLVVESVFGQLTSYPEGGPVNAVNEAKQVLVVDDDRLIRVMVGSMVRDAGFEPVIASSAREAIGSLATLQPLAAFIDLYMPDSPGDECCKIIKSNEELADVPIVLMTAANAEAEVQRAFLAGADDFLPKPVRAYQLAAKLKAVREGLRRPKQERDAPVKRVLLADHDGFFRALVGNLLERAGYEVIQAETALSALRTMLQGRPKLDLCILNITMPGFDGLELLRKIRAAPELAKLPIFVTTESKDQVNIREELYTLGIRYLIQKSALNLEDVLRRVNQQLFRGRESRTLKRARFYRVCDFRYSGDGDWLSGFIYNLSAGGVALRTLTALPTGTAADIRFNLTPQTKCETRATVAWANEFNPQDTASFPYGMGLQFAGITPEFEERIGSFLTAALEAESGPTATRS